MLLGGKQKKKGKAGNKGENANGFMVLGQKGVGTHHPVGKPRDSARCGWCSRERGGVGGWVQGERGRGNVSISKKKKKKGALNEDVARWTEENHLAGKRPESDDVGKNRLNPPDIGGKENMHRLQNIT